jgi:hypothetical protein
MALSLKQAKTGPVAKRAVVAKAQVRPSVALKASAQPKVRRRAGQADGGRRARPICCGSARSLVDAVCRGPVLIGGGEARRGQGVSLSLPLTNFSSNLFSSLTRRPLPLSLPLHCSLPPREQMAMAAGLGTALALAVPSAAQAAQEAFMVAEVRTDRDEQWLPPSRSPLSLSLFPAKGGKESARARAQCRPRHPRSGARQGFTSRARPGGAFASPGSAPARRPRRRRERAAGARTRGRGGDCAAPPRCRSPLPLALPPPSRLPILTSTTTTIKPTPHQQPSTHQNNKTTHQPQNRASPPSCRSGGRPPPSCSASRCRWWCGAARACKQGVVVR